MLRFRRTQFSLSGIVPLSVADWNTTWSGAPPLSAMETRAGLRWPSGRRRIRSLRAFPSCHAVSAVKVGKSWSALVSCASRTLGCLLVSFWGLGCWDEYGGLASVLGAERAMIDVVGCLLS